MNIQYLRYDNMGVHYRIPPPVVPDTLWLGPEEPVVIGNRTRVTRVEYLLGTDTAGEAAKMYDAPFEVKNNTMLRTWSVNRRGRKSSVVTAVILKGME